MNNATLNVAGRQHSVALLCNVLIHRGEILQKAITKKGVSHSELARRMDTDRSTVYRHVQKQFLDDALMLKYGKVLDYDFSNEIPELFNSMRMVNEPSSEYRNKTYDELLIEKDYWKDKYIQLLEKYNRVIEEKLTDKDDTTPTN